MNMNQLIQTISNFKIQNSRKQLQHVYNQNWYQNYLESKWWISFRKWILCDNDNCKMCGSKEHLNIHHLNYNNLYNETEHDVIVVCKSCHKSIHNL